MEIVTSDGRKMCCSRTEEEEVFLAACCGLGSVGIVITVTLLCEPGFRLRENRYACELSQVLENLDVHLQSSDHFRCLWYPHTDTAVCFHLTRTEQEITKPSLLSRLHHWLVEYGFGYYGMEFLLYLSMWFPSWVPWLNSLFLSAIFAPRRERVDVSYRVFNYECRFRQHVNEWSIPREHTALALWKLKEWIDTTPNAYVHIPVEIRFVRADDIYLSPAFGRDSCYINVIMYRPYGRKVAYERYWAAYESIMRGLGGRPHWAKVSGRIHFVFTQALLLPTCVLVYGLHSAWRPQAGWYGAKFCGCSSLNAPCSGRRSVQNEFASTNATVNITFCVTHRTC